MSETPELTADPWIRFDHWAEQAHQAAQGAIAAEIQRGDHNDCTGGICDAYSRAADVYRDLANACSPDSTPAAIEHVAAAVD